MTKCLSYLLPLNLVRTPFSLYVILSVSEESQKHPLCATEILPPFGRLNDIEGHKNDKKTQKRLRKNKNRLHDFIFRLRIFPVQIV